MKYLLTIVIDFFVDVAIRLFFHYVGGYFLWTITLGRFDPHGVRSVRHAFIIELLGVVVFAVAVILGVMLI